MRTVITGRTGIGSGSIRAAALTLAALSVARNPASAAPPAAPTVAPAAVALQSTAPPAPASSCKGRFVRETVRPGDQPQVRVLLDADTAYARRVTGSGAWPRIIDAVVENAGSPTDDRRRR